MPAWQGLQSVSRASTSPRSWRARSRARAAPGDRAYDRASARQRSPTLFRAACRAELEALKPGNVHVHAAGHGMTVADFLASAEAAAPPSPLRRSPSARGSWRAVEATRAACGQNTNLGIVLLCAPLAAAAERGGDLRHEPGRACWPGSTARDAVLAYRAIRLAAPGGLGSSDRHDVARRARRSRCSRPCGRRPGATGSPRNMPPASRDVFELGVPRLLACRAAGWTEPWAVTATYLAFLAAFPDTHVVRKHGRRGARRSRRRRAGLDERMLAAHGCRTLLQPSCSTFDAELKERGHQSRHQRRPHRRQPFCRRACRRRRARHRTDRITQSSQMLVDRRRRSRRVFVLALVPVRASNALV